MLPQLIGYYVLKNGKTISFICDDKKLLLEKYTEIWEKIRSKIGKEFAKKPIYRSKEHVYRNTNIREHGAVIRTEFHKNKVSKTPNAKFPYKSLVIIKLESIIRAEENLYYPQTMLEECKYDVNDIKRNRQITKDFERSTSDESDTEPDNELDDGSDDDDDDDEYFRKSENNESENNEHNESENNEPNKSKKPSKKSKKPN